MACGRRPLAWAVEAEGRRKPRGRPVGVCCVAATGRHLHPVLLPTGQSLAQSAPGRRGIWSRLLTSVAKRVWTHFKSSHATIVITKNMK